MAIEQFLKDFNTLVEEHLTDFANQFESCDTSQGSPAYLLSTIMASPEWGVRKQLNWLARQLFVSTCDDDTLILHGAEFGIAKIESETWSAYRQRILSRKRNPPSALNRAAMEALVLSVSYDHGTYTESVKTVAVYEHARGTGTVNYVITSTRTELQGGEEEPTSELVAAVEDAIEDARAPGLWDNMVIAATKNTIDVTLEYTGDCDEDETESDIEAFMKTAAVGQKFYIDQIKAIAINNGADTVSVSDPAADVEVEAGPLVYERMWPGTISASEA
jgi:uncharacterized phage protein gp47/JayE